MGDVYDAMNRAQQDKKAKPYNGESGGSTSPQENPTSASPIEQSTKAAAGAQDTMEAELDPAPSKSTRALKFPVPQEGSTHKL